MSHAFPSGSAPHLFLSGTIVYHAAGRDRRRADRRPRPGRAVYNHTDPGRRRAARGGLQRALAAQPDSGRRRWRRSSGPTHTQPQSRTTTAVRPKPRPPTRFSTGNSPPPSGVGVSFPATASGQAAKLSRCASSPRSPPYPPVYEAEQPVVPSWTLRTSFHDVAKLDPGRISPRGSVSTRTEGNVRPSG